MRSPNISSKNYFWRLLEFFPFRPKKGKVKNQKNLFFFQKIKKNGANLFYPKKHTLGTDLERHWWPKPTNYSFWEKGKKPFLAPYQSWRNRVKWYWKKNHRKLAITNCQSSIHLGPHAKTQRRIQRKYLRTDQFILNFGIIFCTTVVLNIVKSKNRKNYNFCSFLTI